MKSLFSIVFFLLPFAVLSDGSSGCCCCCDNPGGEGGGENDGSSVSCVAMSPDDCSSLKASLTQKNQDSLDSASDAYDRFLNVIRPHAQAVYDIIDDIVYNSLPRFQTIIQGAEAVDSSLNSYFQNLNSSLTQTSQVLTEFAKFQKGILFVSNTITHVTGNISSPRNPNLRLPIVTNYLNQVISDLQSFTIPTNSEVIAEANSLHNDILQRLNSAITAITALQRSIDLVESDLSAISYNLTQSRAFIDGINCAACTASSGGGGSGGGSGSTVDLTPVINAIQSFQDDVDEHIQSIIDLIATLIQDYSTAALSSIDREGGPSWTGYNRYRGDNWFKGIEYLLYTVASPSLDPLEPEEDFNPDETSTITSIVDDSDSKVEALSNQVVSASVDSNDSSLFRLKTKISALFDSFKRFKTSTFFTAGVSTPPSVVIGDFTIDPPYVPSDVSNVVDRILVIFRSGFIALYYIGSVFLIVALVFVTFRAIGRILRFLFQIYASLFGGSS